jgi:hypothetical protein
MEFRDQYIQVLTLLSHNVGTGLATIGLAGAGVTLEKIFK